MSWLSSICGFFVVIFGFSPMLMLVFGVFLDLKIVGLVITIQGFLKRDFS